MLTGIVVALPEETSTLTATKMAKGDWFFISESLLMTCAGTGPENACIAAEQLMSQGAQRLISWGCAAALNNTLRPGDMIITNTLIDTEFTRFELKTSWAEKTVSLLQDVLVVHNGSLAESKAIVSSSAHKQQLYANTGADILDMESVAVAKVAQQYNVPFLAIRAVADPATMTLPTAVSSSLNAEGQIQITKLLLFLLLHPMELPELIRLGWYFSIAKKKLRQVASHLTTIANLE